MKLLLILISVFLSFSAHARIRPPPPDDPRYCKWAPQDPNRCRDYCQQNPNDWGCRPKKPTPAPQPAPQPPATNDVSYCERYPYAPDCDRSSQEQQEPARTPDPLPLPLPSPAPTYNNNNDSYFCATHPDAYGCARTQSPDPLPQPMPPAPAPTEPQREPVVRKPVPQPMPAPVAQPEETKIVLVTDEPGAEAAQNIAEVFRTMTPFSCMNLPIEIVQINSEELGCNPTVVDRVLKCTDHARNLARSYQLKYRARVAILVVDYPEWGGAGHKSVPMVTTGIAPPGAIHELLHSVGYPDAYKEGETPKPGGTIMNSVDGYIPQDWWPKIALYFKVPTPDSSCGR